MKEANPYAPPRASVSDVLVDDELEHASRGIRLGAALLDTFLIMCAIYLPIILVGIFGYGDVGSDSAVWAILMGWLVILISLVIYLGITLYFVARDGQTLAKKWLGIKVVRGDGSKASLGRIFVLRNLISWLLAFTGLYPLIDALFIFGDNRQCLHDKMADTIVVVA
jgi:uncharacterized RDD family membrane protein YckC